ncbi:DUF6603 domain-containing protein [Sorangium sp. So ce185]|uniref:DUF6603 domain-containing protein n=1 Tax=Sorangium sp. So ce185 TaxID=3133287 RepID=UPI003F61DE40
MALDIVIGEDDLASIRTLREALHAQFQVDFFPGFLDTLDEHVPLQSAEFYANHQKNQYEIAFAIGIKVSEDDEGEAQHLILGMNIVIKPDKNTGGKRPAEYGGKIDIPVSDDVRLAFEGQFTSKMGDMYVAQLNVTGEPAIPLHALFGGVAPGLAALIPEELAIPLGGNVVAVLSGRAGSGLGSRILVGVGFHAGVNLGQLPLVGLYFEDGKAQADFTLELLATTHDWTHKELKALNGVLEDLESPFLIRPSSSSAQDLTRGAHLVGYAAFGDIRQTWYTPLRPRSGSWNPFLAAAGRSAGRAPRSAPDDALVTVGQNGAWIDVQRAVGPVHFARLGLTYSDGAAELVPEVVLSVGPLRLLLNGVSVRLPLPGGDPELRLDGFGLAYENDALRVGGAFLRSERDGYEEYAGMAALELRLKASGGKPPASIGLAAIGAYAYVEDRPSLFLYATLKYPLGGPPFFFVTGLSAGFGYGRSLEDPRLEDVARFPLVAQAVDDTGDDDTDDPGVVAAGQLRELSRYITIAPDAGFLAIGVKFTSFKMLEGFALLTAELGDRFELGLLGLTRLEVPFGVPEPLVVMETALQARFAPSEGTLLVQGQLTDASYLLSPSCRLTGGFAFATWFAGEKAGDFVFTIGGYHPSFKVPKHYPTVPRVGFDLRLGSTLSLRGEAYMALCAHAVMAGGSFAADFEAGPAWASFRMGADFLICWKPYCYDVHLRQHFKFGLGPLSASLGAELHVWGPDLGGYAKLKVFLFSVTVRFGNRDAFGPVPIEWPEFRASLLPADEEVCSVAVAEGLMRQVKTVTGDALWVVNPKDVALTIDSVIPIKEAYHPGEHSPAQGNAKFGVAPMGVTAGNLRSELHVSIWRDGVGVERDKFTLTALQRRAPAAVWGEPRMNGDRLRFPDVNGTPFVEGALSGLRIEPAQPPKGGDTDDVAVRLLLFEPGDALGAHAFAALPAFRAAAGDDAARRAAIQGSIAGHAGRDVLLAALGFDPAADVALDAGVADTFVFAPQVKDTSAAA